MSKEFPCEVKRFRKWGKVKEYFRNLSSTWIFRGQCSAKWGLESSLERVVKDYKPADRVSVEKFFIFQFKRRAHNCLNPSLLPKNERDILEWLALMQHHGAPTRLLDFTKSPYIATFFAIEKADEDCAVWAIDKGWCLLQSSTKIANKLNFGNLNSLEFLLRNPETLPDIFAAAFFQSPNIPCALAVEPYRMNERLNVQQGCFLCPGDVRRSFQENLLDSDQLVGVQGYIRKLVIPQKIQNEALYDLQLMNINRASLFPGFDGFAQSLKDQIWSANEEHLGRMFEESFVDEMVREMGKKLRNMASIEPDLVKEDE